MSNQKPARSSTYTCNEYRLEMRLLGMRRQLASDTLSEQEREKLQSEIDQLEKEIGMS